MKTDKPPAPAADPIETVAGFILQGHSNAHILEFLEKNEMTIDAAKIALEKALGHFTKASKIPRAIRKGWCLEAFRYLYQKMQSTGDYTGALKAVKEIANLADLYPGKNNDQPKPDEQDEIDEYIDDLMSL